MEYYSKYIKYKNKYLYLKNINNIIKTQQIGGDKPSVFSTKQINIIKYDTLNPFNGFIWFSSNLIRNYYKFDGSILGNLVRSLFIIIGDSDELRVTKYITDDIKPYQLGMIISQCFLYIYGKNKYSDEKNNMLFTNDNELLKNSDSIQILYDLIISNIKKIKHGKDTDTEMLVLNFFNILLAVMWYITDNREGILEYYKGINHVFTKQQISEGENGDKYEVNLDDFNKDNLYNYNDLINYKPDEKLDYEYLASIIYYHHNKIQLNDYETVYINGFIHKINDINIQLNNISFSDCGETTIRNFFKILFMRLNESKTGFIYDTKLMEEFGVIKEVIDFFKKYDTEEKQNSDKLLDNLNARQAWALVVNNISDISYAQEYTQDATTFKYEIKPGFAQDNKTMNIMKLIYKLITKINNKDTLINMISVINNKNGLAYQNIYKENFDEDGTGVFVIKTIYGEFIFNCDDAHYYIDKKTVIPLNINIDHIKDPIQKITLLSLNNNLKNVTEFSVYKPYMYLKLNNKKDLYNIINTYGARLEDGDYSKFINEIYKLIEDDYINKDISWYYNLKNKLFELNELNESLNESLNKSSNAELLSKLNQTITRINNINDIKDYNDYKQNNTDFLNMKILLYKLNPDVFEKINTYFFNFNKDKLANNKTRFSYNVTPKIENISELRLKNYLSEEINNPKMKARFKNLATLIIIDTTDKLIVTNDFPKTNTLALIYSNDYIQNIPTDLSQGNITKLYLYNDMPLPKIPKTLKTLQLNKYNQAINPRALDETTNLEIYVKSNNFDKVFEKFTKDEINKYKIIRS